MPLPNFGNAAPTATLDDAEAQLPDYGPVQPNPVAVVKAPRLPNFTSGTGGGTPKLPNFGPTPSSSTAADVASGKIRIVRPDTGPAPIMLPGAVGPVYRPSENAWSQIAGEGMPVTTTWKLLPADVLNQLDRSQAVPAAFQAPTGTVVAGLPAALADASARPEMRCNFASAS